MPTVADGHFRAVKFSFLTNFLHFKKFGHCVNSIWFIYRIFIVKVILSVCFKDKVEIQNVLFQTTMDAPRSRMAKGYSEP